MSRSVSIWITLERAITEPLHILTALTQLGWTYSLHNDEQIMYLPMGDRGSYEWQFAPMTNLDGILGEMRAKFANTEEIGIVMHSDGTSMHILFPESYTQMRFLIYNVGRKFLNGIHQVTDFSWYLNNILPSVADNRISAISCDESF
jgi:hypothetical protein